MANDPNTIQYVIQEDGFWYIASKDRTPGVPEITLSSRGVANGLSTEYNDGYDFGPDSYNPNSTASIPYTQTVGIMEAIDSLPTVYSAYTKRYVHKGKILLTSASVYSGTSPIVVGDDDQIEIIGTIAPAGSNYSPSSDYTMCTTINMESDQGNFVLYDYATSVSSNHGGVLTLDNLYFYSKTQITNPLKSAYTLSLNTSWLDTIHIGYIAVYDGSGGLNGAMIIASNGSDTIIDAKHIKVAGTTNQVGIVYIGVNNFKFDLLDITGLEFASSPTSSSTTNAGLYIAVGGQAIIGSLHLFENFNSFLLVSNLGESINSLYIANLFLEMTAPSTSNPYSLSLGTRSMFYTSVLVEKISIGSTFNPWTTDTGTVNILLAEFDTSSYHFGSIKILDPTVFNTVSPSISANPPASGTAYQNTLPYDIEIVLPVYATTSGTAGYVTVAKGSSSSSLTTIGNQFVNGSTSSTSVDIIRLRVPAGWYYEFTASGVTFGTASVFAD